MSHHLPHAQSLEYSLRREVTEIYLSVTIKHFGLALLSVFEVLYLFQWMSASLPLLLLFFGMNYLIHAFFTPVAAIIVSRIGVKRSILLANPFLMLYFVSLLFLASWPWLILVAMVSLAVYHAIFWLAFHVDFARFANPQHRGRQTSMLLAIPMIAHAVGPLIGGFLITQFGFPTLFLIVIICLGVSALPLFFSQELHEPFRLHWKQTLQYAFSFRHWRRNIVFAADGITNKINVVIWPVFLFLTITNFVDLGVINSVAFLLTLLMGLYIGHLTDSPRRKVVLVLGSFFSAFGWFARILLKTPLQLFAFDAYGRVARRVIDVPLNAMFYQAAYEHKENKTAFIAGYEMVHNLFGGFFLILLAAFANIVDPYLLAFIAAGVLSTLFPLMSSTLRRTS